MRDLQLRLYRCLEDLINSIFPRNTSAEMVDDISPSEEAVDYIFPQLVSQLKFLCTPFEYKYLIGRKSYEGRENKPEDIRYREVLPSYLYARCPICGRESKDKIDTYGFRPGGISFPLNEHLLPRSYPMSANPPCQHFLGTHTFKNLHNQLPLEAGNFNNVSGKLPYVTPWFLPDDIESYCVLHGIPICRTIDNKFQPVYTMFILTYFSENPRLLIDRHYASESQIAMNDPEYDPITAYPAGLYRDEAIPMILQALKLDEEPDLPLMLIYDLPQWASVGKLGYLDVTTNDFSLKIGKDLKLPDFYQDIEGRLEPYRWRDKKIRR